MNHNNNKSGQGASEPNDGNRNTGDQVNFTSSDGLVEVVTKVETARRNPPHNYPIVCLRLRPKNGERIQAIGDGSGGLDVLLRHPEISGFLTALNQADAKARYMWREIPEKEAARKAYWDKKNQERWQNREK